MAAASTIKPRTLFLLLAGLLLTHSVTFTQEDESSDAVDQNTDQTVVDLDTFQDPDEQDDDTYSSSQSTSIMSQRRIRKIVVEGNKYVPTTTVLRRSPYKEGQIFDARKSGQLIKNVFDVTARGGAEPGKGSYPFKHVKLEAELIGSDQIDLYIVVQEKFRSEGAVFKGNKHLAEKDIKKKLDFDDITFIDYDDLPQYVGILKGLYKEKDYHNVEIKAHLDVKDDRATVIFDVTEHSKSLVKHVEFRGNDNVDGKKLRSMIFTREDWILGFLDRAGSYQPEAIEGDKQIIENFYQSNGYLKAKVYDVAVDRDPYTQDICVTFYIDEGAVYTVSDIHVPGDENVSEEYLLCRLPIQVGEKYSREKIRETIEWLRLFWGEYGYIYADIEPSIQPNDDTKTVELGFYSELGPKVYLNRINIIGNTKTRDKVIRRQLVLEEGDLLTTQRMEVSKHRVESLGYFDTRGGVNWKIHRLNKDQADLDLILRETKTGKIFGQLGFGGAAADIQNPTNSMTLGGVIADSNLFGLGINFNLSGELSKQNRSVTFNVINPWLFDLPIYAAIDANFKRSIYDDFKSTQREVTENFGEAALSLGFTSRRLNDTTIVGKIGLDTLDHAKPPVASQEDDEVARLQYQRILNQRFANGSFVWTSAHSIKDIRNHPLHPSKGYQWTSYLKIGLPGTDNFNPFTVGSVERYGFVKFDADASWYTPLIGERDLVLVLHGHIGVVAGFTNKIIPYRELYNIGGPATVRGFLFGQIGPTFFGDPIGAKKAVWLNAELLFPIASDFSIKGAFFYDGGTGWDTPNGDTLSPEFLRNNGFNYRHAFGFGVRILNPTPIQIDWGFKLDRKPGETSSEVHLNMTHNF